MKTTWIPVILAGVLTACAGAPGPPPQATAIPYSPVLITMDRAGAANDWRTDVATREAVGAYIVKLAAAAQCDPAWWSGVNAAWSVREDKQWTLLWTFQPIPNAPASSGSSLDLLNALVGLGIKAAPLLLARTAAPLPTC